MSAPAPRAMAEFAASRHGLVARSQAASFGFTPRDIRLAKERGWYPPTWEQRLAIVTATSASRPVVGDGAAARLFLLDGFDSAGPALTVVRPDASAGTSVADAALAASGRVDFLEQPLDSAGYDALLASTDCMVLPYRRSSYFARISGVAVEAVTGVKKIAVAAERMLFVAATSGDSSPRKASKGEMLSRPSQVISVNRKKSW